MNKTKFYFLFLLLIAPLFSIYSQENKEEKGSFSVEIDSLYREDQFYFGVTYNLLLNKPEDVTQRGLSGGIHFGYMRDMPINKRRNIAIAVGAGFSFNTYGQNLFIGEDANDQTIFRVLRNDEVNFDQNRLSTYIVEVPFEFRWRSSTPETYKFWRIYGGIKAGYAYYYKSTFKQPENTVIQTDISEFDPFRLNATFSFGYNTVNFNFQYSLMPLLSDGIIAGSGEAVEINTLKMGLIFYIL